MNRYFSYFLLFVFVVAILLIVFLQFNSNRSINQLIYGNENMLDELQVKNKLQRLQTDILTLESKVRGFIIAKDTLSNIHLDQDIADIRSSLERVNNIKGDDTTSELIVRLNRLVQAKIQFNYDLLDSFSRNGKEEAEKLINIQKNKLLSDSIRAVSSLIDNDRQNTVTALIREADANGARAKAMGSIMALIAALAAIFTFGYVTFKVRQQQQLIHQLDTSEKKAREAMAVKENFMANMSHEIRTPMNAILGFTHLLQKQNLDEKSRQYVQAIESSGENLLTIINDILDFSKIEAGMLRIEKIPFSIRGLLHSIETMFTEKVKLTDISFSVYTDESIPDALVGDPVRLTQILVNLISNALKFTSSGMVMVKVVNEGREEDIIHLGITVKDTGIGISKEKLPFIFERFHQAEEETTRKYGGTGLGLTIVKELTELQGGSINVKSETGKGTEFILHIPYKISRSQAAKKQAGDISGLHQHDLKEISVLVVEDNAMNQSLMRHLMEEWGIRCTITGNGKEAMSVLKRNSFDIILMDIQMPEMDGYTTARKIREELKLDTPLIAMTAHAFAGEREKCIGFGMNEYISKPIKEQQLIHLITRLTKKKLSGASEKDQPDREEKDKFSTIDLGYLRELSGGNTDFEKTMARQFTEELPPQLAQLENNYGENEIKKLKEVAHNMKTTISFMGLTAALEPYLDDLEKNASGNSSTRETIEKIKQICSSALEEAREIISALV